MSDFERELEQELHRVLDAVSARPIPARRPIRSRRTATTLMGGAGAALGVKVLSGVVVAAAAVTVAGFATTDSLNPGDWSQHVKQHVFNNAAAPQQDNTATPKDKTNGNADSSGNNGSSGGSGSGNGKHLASPNSQPTMGPEPAEPVDPSSPLPHVPVLISPPPYNQ
jgi:uncharacterized membrane protein YgcG